LPDIRPFTPYYYACGRAGEQSSNGALRKAVAPPYDVISKDDEKRMKQFEYNITHIILPETYKKAAEIQEKWVSENIFINNAKKAMYIYGIEFTINDDPTVIKRYGIVALLRLTEFFSGADVHPHEMTFPKYTEDRFKLISETDSNYSPIFTIYDGKGFANEIINKHINGQPFLETVDDDGFAHKIWVIENEQDIEYIQNKFATTPVIIADGHHRYITALKRSRLGGCKYIMSMFIDFNDPGLKIYTSYRMIKKMSYQNMDEVIDKMKGFFDISELGTFDDLIDAINSERERRAFGLAFNERFVVFYLDNSVNTEEYIDEPQSKKWRNLPVPILHYVVFDKFLKIPKEEIVFKKNLAGIKRLFKDKHFDAVFMVSNTKLEDIKKITELGEIMPQKSTYFFPKPLSGLLIHKHREE